MSDILLELEKNSLAKQIATSIGIPLPPILKRYKGPWKERILEDKKNQRWWLWKNNCPRYISNYTFKSWCSNLYRSFYRTTSTFHIRRD